MAPRGCPSHSKEAIGKKHVNGGHGIRPISRMKVMGHRKEKDWKEGHGQKQVEKHCLGGLNRAC